MSTLRAISHGPSTPYNSYTAVLTQAGTAVPTLNILNNEIGALVWTRTGVGVYLATLAGAFDVSRFTYALATVSSALAVFVTAQITSANVVTLSFFDAAGAAVDLAGICFIEIRTY